MTTLSRLSRLSIAAGATGIACLVSRPISRDSSSNPPSQTPVQPAPSQRVITQPAAALKAPAPLVGGECTDGKDNDGDGRTDFALDPGCFGPGDGTERALPRSEEAGFTTWDVPKNARVVYVSASGNDAAPGDGPERPVRSIARALELGRDGYPDMILFKRGDTWRGETLTRTPSGQREGQPFIIASYGESLERPRLEVTEPFLNQVKSRFAYLWLVGLHLVDASNDPKDPEFSGESETLLRFMHAGSHLMVEGCHLEFGGMAVQGNKERRYDHVEVRRTTIERAYHVGTCKEGDPRGERKYRPSGLFARDVDHLTLEGNFFDHNGWNDQVEGACATIYNHNTYLNARQLTIKDNVFSRSSSIHVKLNSRDAGDMSDIVISGNYFVEGEVGVSIGGNGQDSFRFINSEVSGNVFASIGRSRPTGRTLAWGIEAIDVDSLAISSNVFVDQVAPGIKNSYAIRVAKQSARQVLIAKNDFRDIPGRALLLDRGPLHTGIQVSENTFASTATDACLVEHQDDPGVVTFSKNRYFSTTEDQAWFCVKEGRVSVEDWPQHSGERGLVVLDRSAARGPSAPTEAYAQSLGLDPTLPAFLAAMRGQSRENWDKRLTANAIIHYVRSLLGPG